MKILTTLDSGLTFSLADTRLATIAIACVCCLCFSASGVAREAHGAHVHGVANVTLAFESGALEVQFESPAMSVLGFEHKPKSQEQLDMVRTSKALLESPEKVLAISGAKCVSSSVEVDILGPAGEVNEGKDEHNEDHDDKNDHGHADSEHGHKDHSERHSEISAVYVFGCESDQSLNSLRVLLFEHFPGLEKINVNWVSETQQGQLVLRRSAPVVEFPVTN